MHIILAAFCPLVFFSQQKTHKNEKKKICTIAQTLFLALEEAGQIVCKMARDEVLAGPTLYQVCKSCNKKS